MATIQYEINHKFVTVEVNDEVKKVYNELTAYEKNRNRTETRRHQSLDATIEQGIDFPDTAPNPEETVLNAELTDMLRSALKLLTTQQKEIFFAYALNNENFLEIADRLHLSPATVYTHFQRAQKKLQTFLEFYVKKNGTFVAI